MVLDLALGQRIQAEDAHAASQRVRQGRNQQNVGGAGQDEAPRRPPPVDGGLERGEELRNPLYLVQNRLRGQAVDEPDRISRRGRPDRVIVERQVAVASWLPDSAGQRRLPALTRAVNQDGWRIRQGLADPGSEVAREGRGAASHGQS